MQAMAIMQIPHPPLGRTPAGRRTRLVRRRAGLGDASSELVALQAALEGAISGPFAVSEAVAPNLAANATGVRITPAQQAAIDQQTQAEITQACGAQANTAWCQSQISGALSAVNAQIGQSNQQPGFPASAILSLLGTGSGNGNGGSGSSSLPWWVWLAAAGVGVIVLIKVLE